MDWLSNLHDEVEGVEDEQGIACGVFKIGAKLSGRQFPASYNNNSNNDNNNHNTSSVSNHSNSNRMIGEDPWCVPVLTQIVRAGSAGKAARSKRSRGSNYAGGWTVSSSNSGLLESVTDSSRGSLDSDLLTDLSSTSNTFCQSEIVNLIRPSITPLRNNIPASNLPRNPPSADDDDHHHQKKSSKMISRENKALADDSGRRCTHCQSQKTPQWRLGPAGPKTLCNACGVRFKSGRLFPEYRPANSPTFISHRHSNSHRKVLEMRKHKGLPPLLGVALPSPVARFKAATISGMDSSWTIQNSTKLPKRKQASTSSSDSSSAAIFHKDGHGDEYNDDGDYNEEEDAEEEDDDDIEDDEEEEEEAC